MPRISWSFLILLVIGCKSEVTSYDLAYARLDDVKAVGNFDNTYEQGEFEYHLENSLLKKGKYNNGQKIGIWEYFLGSDLYRIDWTVYSRKDDSLSTSIPDFWKYYENKDKLFMADVTPDISNDKKKFFAILQHDLTNINISMDELAGSFYSTTNEIFDIKNSEIYKVSSENQSYYYLKIDSKFEDDDYLILTFLFKKEDSMYEISLIHDQDRKRIKEIIFFDAIYSTFIQGERVLSPFQKVEVNPVNPPSI